MPVYNGEPYIVESINSIINQSFKNWRLIIIDDQSTDNSVEIVQTFDDPRIVLIQNNNKKGIVGALNTGLSYSTAPYIARLDCDDLSRKYRLEKQVRYLDEHPEIFLLGGGYFTFNSKGKKREIIHPSGSLLLALKMIDNSFFCHPTVMFRRAVIDTIGMYPDVIAEDYAFFSKIVQTYPSDNLSEVLIDYREHDNNLSRTKEKLLFESSRNISAHNYKHYLSTMFGYRALMKNLRKEKASFSELFLGRLIKYFISKKILNQYKTVSQGLNQ